MQLIQFGLSDFFIAKQDYVYKVFFPTVEFGFDMKEIEQTLKNYSTKNHNIDDVYGNDVDTRDDTDTQ